MKAIRAISNETVCEEIELASDSSSCSEETVVAEKRYKLCNDKYIGNSSLTLSSQEDCEISSESNYVEVKKNTKKTKKKKRKTCVEAVVEKPIVDLEPVIKEYLTLTNRKLTTADINLDDYHRWMQSDENPLILSKTLRVLKNRYESHWDPRHQVNRQGTVKSVNEPKTILELILKELDYTSTIMNMKSEKSTSILLSIESQPKWSFFGSGCTKQEALENAAQSAIQFFLLMAA